MTTVPVCLGHKHLLEQPLSLATTGPAPPVKRRCAVVKEPEEAAASPSPCPLHALLDNDADSNETCLHLLGNITACLQDDSDAAKTLDVNRRPPLLYAIQRGCSTKVLELLFDAHPDGIVQVDRMGQTALGLPYHASKSSSMLQYILGQKPSLALWQSNSFSRRKLVDTVCQNWNKASLAHVEQDLEGWTKLVLTVKAAHRATFGSVAVEEDGYDELHIALELGLSSNLIRLFLTMYPRQAARGMSRMGGMLPLHFVAMHKLIDRPTFDASVIRLLIKPFPAAASRPYKGQLPLHAALAAGQQWTHGVREIAFAFPSALHTTDSSCQYPVLIAAFSDACTLDTLFCVLRECPCLSMH